MSEFDRISKYLHNPRVIVNMSETPLSIAFLQSELDSTGSVQYHEILPPEIGRRTISKLVATDEGFTNLEDIYFGPLTTTPVRLDGFGVYYPAMDREPILVNKLAYPFYMWSHENNSIQAGHFIYNPFWEDLKHADLVDAIKNAPKDLQERRKGPRDRRK